MSVDWNDIKKEYIDSKGKAVLKDLADKHGVKIGTLRSRKSREDWDSEIDNVETDNATQRKENKNVATQKKTTKIIKEVVKDIDREIVEEVIENNELTDKQQLFCIHYIKCFNATKAYQKAYGCDYISAMSNSSRLIRNDKVRNQINSLKQGKLNKALLSEDDIFQKYMDIAFAEVTDYMEFGTEDVPDINHMTGEQEVDKEGNPIFYKRNYLHFNDSSEVDGSLISEVSQGKDGVKVKLHDKMKALQWLAEHMDLLTTANKEKLQLERDKLGANEEGQESQDWAKAIIENAKKRREKNERDN